ncbi:hypothetical protein [Nocardioides montaniterrae]
MSRPLVGPLRRRRDERGAVGVMFAILMALLIPVTSAFVLDLGVQRVGRADMQTLADVVAMDMSRLLDGTKTVSQLSAGGADITAANASRDRNTSVIDYATSKPTMGITWGTENLTTGVFAAASAATVPNAVKVTATTQVGFGFAAFTGIASGQASRNAVSYSNPGACFRVGSFVAALDTGDSSPLINAIVGGALGSSLNLDLVSYKALAGANVSLADLVNTGQLHVGSVTELLSDNTLNIADLVTATAMVMSSNGGYTSAQITAINAVKTAIGASGPVIKMGDLLAASSGDQSALNASLNVLDIVTGSALVAGKGHALSLQGVNLNLPLMAGKTVTSSTSLNVIESPQEGCTGQQAHTAQVQLTTTLTIPALTLSNVNFAGVTSSIATDATTLTLKVNLGEAIATLAGIAGCSTGSPTSLSVLVNSAILGSTSLTGSMGAHLNFSFGVSQTGTLVTDILNLLGLGSLLSTTTIALDSAVTLSANFPNTFGSYSQTVTVPLPDGYTNPAKVNGNVLSSPTLNPSSALRDTSVTTTATVTTKLLALLLPQTKPIGLTSSAFSDLMNPILTTVSSTLDPVLTAVQSSLITPLSKMLGLRVGGADVYAVPTPTCNQPRLVG